MAGSNENKWSSDERFAVCDRRSKQIQISVAGSRVLSDRQRARWEFEKIIQRKDLELEDGDRTFEKDDLDVADR